MSTTCVKTGRQNKAVLKIPKLSHRRCRACAQSLPDSQQVDPRAWTRWKEDTFMHDVELSDRQDFTGSSRNPDRKNALRWTKNTPVASVRETISHNELIHKPRYVGKRTCSNTTWNSRIVKIFPGLAGITIGKMVSDGPKTLQ